jgi:hypothetical protein
MRWRLRSDVNCLKRIPICILTFLRNDHRSASFQTGDLPVDMQHLRFEKRRAITSDNRGGLGCGIQRSRLDVQRSASKSITPEKRLRAWDFSQPKVSRHSKRSEEALVIRDRRATTQNRDVSLRSNMTASFMGRGLINLKSKTARVLPAARGLAGRFAH